MTTSITEIFSTVFVIVDKRSDDEVVSMFITADTDLQLPEIGPCKTYRPGMHKTKWTLAQTKEVISLLKKQDYKVILYKLEAVRSWFNRFESIPGVTVTPSIEDVRDFADSLPGTHTYVELFGGGLPFIYLREPAPVEVYNDISSHVVGFMRALRYPEQFGWMFMLSRLFPPTDLLSPAKLSSFVRSGEEGDDVVRAYSWFYQTRQVFVEAPDALVRNSVLMESSEGDDVDQVIDALTAVDPLLPAVHGRIFRAQIENNEWQKVVEIYDSEDTLFWVDPPYRGIGFLRLDDDPELSTFDHLVDGLGDIKGKVALYDPHDGGHPAFDKRETVGSLKMAGFKPKKLRTCTIWLKNL